jgi:hypothetical protein
VTAGSAEARAAGLGGTDSGFGVVAAADWSMSDAKRWVCAANWDPQGGCWRVGVPERVKAAGCIEQLVELANGRAVLLGLDLPVGVPEAYGRLSGCTDFRDLLLTVTGGDDAGTWAGFFQRSRRPCVHRPFYPSLPVRTRGEVSRRALAEGVLGTSDGDGLLRACDRQSGAECMFFTLGGAQVGGAVISAWPALVAPAVRSGRCAVWPFDGELADLARRAGTVTLAEIYPGEAYGRLGVKIGSGSGRSKRRVTDRTEVAAELRAAVRACGAKASAALVRAMAAGFDPPGEFGGEDGFDALVGVLGMLAAMRDDATAPRDAAVRRWEGWILGLPVRAGGD